jgi:K+-sensing histidine kinase KdpD
VLASVGSSDPADSPLTVEVTDRLRLEATGPALFAEDRALLHRLAESAARAYEGEQLAAEAARSVQLAEVDRLRSALLAAVGHDLRTPLAGIKAAVTSLRQSDVTWTPEQEAELLATIEASADRLDDLISNLLAMSRLQAGALSAVLEPVAVDEVVARALLHTPTDRVDVNVPDDLPAMLADAGLLERVVANLLDNARRFSAPTGQINLMAGINAEAVWLSISDHGRGVPPDQWEQMFAPFQRLGGGAGPHGQLATGSRGAGTGLEGGGVGLGLAIVRGFVQSMGGTVTPSETPGGGLTMTIRLAAA